MTVVFQTDKRDAMTLSRSFESPCVQGYTQTDFFPEILPSKKLFQRRFFEEYLGFSRVFSTGVKDVELMSSFSSITRDN
jgi:hypothetical protein